jgi:hypothetical protein
MAASRLSPSGACFARAAGAILAILMLTAWTLLPGPAQTAQKPASDFWNEFSRQRPAAAAEVVGIRDPLTALAMTGYGQATVLWGLPPVPDRAPPLDPDLLAGVLDKKSLPDFRQWPARDWERWQIATYRLYCQAVLQAAQTPPEAFAKSARENAFVDWGSMFRNPGKFRGEVIPVKGVLRRLRRIVDPPQGVTRQGITVLWEGWVFTETFGSNPVCVILTDLPAGIKEGERLSQGVTFDGYFLMRYRYLSGYGWRDTLLFIAPTLTLTARPSAAVEPGMFSLSGWMFAGMIALFAGTIALVVGLGWWFRRGDQRFRRRVTEVQAGMFAESELGHEEGPGTVTSVRPEPQPGREGNGAHGP